MTKIKIAPDCINTLAEIDTEIKLLNARKVKLLFEALGITVTATDFEKMTDWTLIIVTVPDKHMAGQLNKLSRYVPNLKFSVDVSMPIFSLLPGPVERRVWK